MNYFAVFLVAVVATTSSAQQQLCSAPGCASRFSDSNVRTSECCKKRPGNFDDCCRMSCNSGSPC
ncbi:PcF and SCR74-like cys-rich secreted peptide [Phytophthora megakarya]|uniref:PcF and SCR74-like cys-rich secreted peptide n=1 Tax=Phytophthora megakarya TaxID=4795 RepID=A0A225WFC9_9STRA|nr:PcF and SCR74-like cys-rich secreted peptide [Phytophthora megakarya]